MPKRFKIKLSKFQLCRSKESPCQSQKQTLASLFSPVNPKARVIFYPTSPEPPPTTPDHPKHNHNNPTARILPASDISDGEISLVTRLKRGKYTKAKASILATTQSTDSGWFSGEDSDSLYSSRSFSSSYDFGYPLETISEDPLEGGKERNKFANKLISLKDDMVKESVMVVKRSDNPYEDFKRSMLEMIMEKKMYGVKDLEQLLQSFLALNSAQYHGAIVEAFAEVWGHLFGKTPNSTDVS